MKSMFKNQFGNTFRGPFVETDYIFDASISPGKNLFDKITKTVATSIISGIRYGIVGGVVTQFAANQPPIEDTGLRGCPAFTQLAKQSESLTDASWGRSNTLTPIASGTFEGSNVWFIAESTATGFHTTLYQATALSGLSENSIVGFSFIFKSVNRKIYARIINKDNLYLTARINNETGVVETVSSGLSVNVQRLTDAFFRVFISASVGVGASTALGRIDICSNDQASYTGDGVSGIYLGHPTYINFGVSGVPFIPPYVPNNTSGSISVVSEAATATTGTSFDLDDAKLAKLKTALRGAGVGPNLWGIPGLLAPWVDNGTHYVCDGTNNNATVSCAGVLSTGKLYDIEFTTGAVTSGTLAMLVGGVNVFSGTPVASTTYKVRTSTIVTGTNITFTNVNAFIGQIRKDIVVKEVQAQGHLELEFVSNVNSMWLANNTIINIFSLNNNYTQCLFFKKDSLGNNTVRVEDQANAAFLSLSPAITQIYKIFLDFGTHSTGQKMRITVNGVKSALTNFSGSFGIQDLKLFFGNTVHAGWIKKDSLKIGNKPKW